jgi:hypothetical protein
MDFNETTLHWPYHDSLLLSKDLVTFIGLYLHESCNNELCWLGELYFLVQSSKALKKITRFVSCLMDC